jgi:hypothetical protein
MGIKKSPITKEEFVKDGKNFQVEIAGNTIVLELVEFSTGSLGWRANAKVSVKVGDKVLPAQLGLNMTIIGSKPLS